MKLSKLDLHNLLRRLPKDVKETLEHESNKGAIIAGGFLRAVIAKEQVSDIDIFTTSEAAAESLFNDLHTEFEWSAKSENAYTFEVNGTTIQIIFRWTFDSPQDVLNHFDFTISCATLFFDGKEWDTLAHDEFYSDLAAKRLVYTNPIDYEAGGSLLRVLKYKGKGYNPTLDTLAEIVGRLAGVEPRPILKKLIEIDPSAFQAQDHKDEKESIYNAE